MAQAWRNSWGCTGKGTPGASSGIAAQGADGSVVERQVAALFGGEEPVGGFPPAVVDPEPLAQSRGQRDVAGHVTFGLADVQQHALRIDVVHFEMAQFVGGQGGGIEGGEDGPVFQVVGVVEDAGDLFGAQDGDEPRPFLGSGDLFVEPALSPNRPLPACAESECVPNPSASLPPERGWPESLPSAKDWAARPAERASFMGLDCGG